MRNMTNTLPKNYQVLFEVIANKKFILNIILKSWLVKWRLIDTK